MKRKHSKKIRNLVAICSLCAIMLSVSTYAWFIGMKTVNVNKFEIDIATTEGLMLSLDGKSWAYQIDPKTSPEYTGHTNQWLRGEKEGLIPMSSVGEVDSNSSTMKLYQKGSLTATPGGYRLMASRVNNHTADSDGKYQEGKGYIAFDLFMMNLSGDEYYVENQPLNEEAIYLTVDSSVKQSAAGVAMDKTGIENSVRVGFAQIARVNAELDLTADDKNTSAATITAMDCNGDSPAGPDPVALDHVTGICRVASIWEPNDTKHVQNAINWYQKSCLLRTGENVTEDGSYTSPSTCKEVLNGTAYSTYAINKELNYTDNINVYDGEDYNGYTANHITYASYLTQPNNNAAKLVEMDGVDANGNNIGYFTDSMKIEKGTDRQPFMTLAPNSITKVRVYVWLEGQDIDNYDFAALGQQISINFGFTKERYAQSDFPDYDGPDVPTTNE